MSEGVAFAVVIALFILALFAIEALGKKKRRRQ